MRNAIQSESESTAYIADFNFKKKKKIITLTISEGKIENGLKVFPLALQRVHEKFVADNEVFRFTPIASQLPFSLFHFNLIWKQNSYPLKSIAVPSIYCFMRIFFQMKCFKLKYCSIELFIHWKRKSNAQRTKKKKVEEINASRIIQVIKFEKNQKRNTKH